MKKLVCLLLALVMIFSLVACNNNDNPSASGSGSNPNGSNSGNSSASTSNTPDDSNNGEDEGPEPYVGPDWDAIAAMDYEDASDALYDYVGLGDFYELYQVAKAEYDNLDLRAALMAVAEAKLLETATLAPLSSNGGNYAMSRIVPRTATTADWGLDEYKYYTILAANELITAEDRVALTKLWNEAADADAWYTAAYSFLEENGYTLTDAYKVNTSYDQETWDIIATSQSSDSMWVAPTVTGLLEYDAKNVQQLAMAESYEVSADGLTYTFHIRQGVQWVDQQGREIGEEVTANDWVTALMHVADNNDELGYLLTVEEGCGLKNYDAYLLGEVSFDEVGVKAVDDYTLEFTLEARFPAFLTMMGYSIFTPLNYNYYKSQGGTFGAEGDTYTAGNYGTSPSTIAYCGPYLVTNYVAGSIWSYSINEHFWNVDAINMKTLDFYYNDGTDTLRTYNETKDGTILGGGLNSPSVVEARKDIPEGQTETYFDLYSYVAATDSTSFVGWYNVNRQMFTNFNDTTAGVSPKIDDAEAQERARDALVNQHFRLAMAYAFDRGAYYAQSVGEDLKYTSLTNTYVPGTFYQFQSDVTVDINGTSTTFKAGQYYGEVIQAQITADGYPIQVWDPNANDGAGGSTGYDGWYNVANAKAELELAIAELAEIGVEISVENPIYIDTYYYTASETNTNMAQAYKQSIENALEGKVIINLVAFDNSRVMQDAYYWFTDGSEANYDFAKNSGWGPDYNDPQSYLDTMQPGAFMCKNIGLY